MNIYKAPNLIISPKRKVWGGEGGGSTMNPFTNTHILSLSHTQTHLSQCQEEKATGMGKDVSLQQI